MEVLWGLEAGTTRTRGFFWRGLSFFIIIVCRESQRDLTDDGRTALRKFWGTRWLKDTELSIDMHSF